MTPEEIKMVIDVAKMTLHEAIDAMKKAEDRARSAIGALFRDRTELKFKEPFAVLDVMAKKFDVTKIEASANSRFVFLFGKDGEHLSLTDVLPSYQILVLDRLRIELTGQD